MNTWQRMIDGAATVLRVQIPARQDPKIIETWEIPAQGRSSRRRAPARSQCCGLCARDGAGTGIAPSMRSRRWTPVSRRSPGSSWPTGSPESLQAETWASCVDRECGRSQIRTLGSAGRRAGSPRGGAATFDIARVGRETVSVIFQGLAAAATTVAKLAKPACQ